MHRTYRENHEIVCMMDLIFHRFPFKPPHAYETRQPDLALRK